MHWGGLRDSGGETVWVQDNGIVVGDEGGVVKLGAKGVGGGGGGEQGTVDGVRVGVVYILSDDFVF